MKTTEELITIIKEFLAISETDDWNGSFRLDDVLEDARTAVEEYEDETT